MFLVRRLAIKARGIMGQKEKTKFSRF